MANGGGLHLSLFFVCLVVDKSENVNPFEKKLLSSDHYGDNDDNSLHAALLSDDYIPQSKLLSLEASAKGKD